MNRRAGGVVLAIAAACVLAPRWTAAATVKTPSAEALLHSHEFARVVEQLRPEVERRPNDPILRRNLGVALLKVNELQASIENLEIARRLRPGDYVTLFFLGRAYQIVDDPERAHAALTACWRRLGPTPLGWQIRADTRDYDLSTMRRVLRSRIARIEQLSLDSIPPRSAVIPAFVVLPEAGDDPNLPEGLMGLLIHDFESLDFTVTDIARIDTLLAEQQRVREAHGVPFTTWLEGLLFGKPDYQNDARIFGARYFVQGGFWHAAPESAQTAADVADIVGGREGTATVPAVANRVAEYLGSLRALLFEVLPSTGLSKHEIASVRNKLDPLPTPEAFTDYSRGVSLLNRSRAGGLTREQQKTLRQQAREAFQQAAQRDPRFRLAREQAGALSVEPSDLGKHDDAMIELMSEAEGLKERILRSGTLMGIGPGPEADWAVGDRGIESALKWDTGELTIHVHIP